MTALGHKSFQSPARQPVDVAALVAQYAPVGRRRRRLQWLRRLLLATAVPTAAAIAVVAIQERWFDRIVQPASPVAVDTSAVDTSQMLRLQALQARLQAEAGSISAERQKWAAQRGEMEAQRADMEAQRVRLEERNATLNAQLATLEARWQELDRQLARERRLVAEQRAEQRAARPARSEPLPAATAASVAREPESPPVRATSIRTEIVDRELKALAAQRAELARQQTELDAQRQELQALMQRYDEAARAAGTPVAGPVTGEAPGPGLAPPTGAATDSGQDPLDDLAEPQLLMAGNRAVGEDALGSMRGGLSVGNGPEISFGITRSAAINGIEQFTNSVYVDDLARLSGAGLDGTAQSVLLQSGTGNYVSADAMAALSGSLGTLIQNTLDSQIIETRTVIDISVGNVGNLVNDLGVSDAVRESLSFQRP